MYANVKVRYYVIQSYRYRHHRCGDRLMKVYMQMLISAHFRHLAERDRQQNTLYILSLLLSLCIAKKRCSCARCARSNRNFFFICDLNLIYRIEINDKNGFDLTEKYVAAINGRKKIINMNASGQC